MQLSESRLRHTQFRKDADHVVTRSPPRRDGRIRSPCRRRTGIRRPREAVSEGDTATSVGQEGSRAGAHVHREGRDKVAGGPPPPPPPPPAPHPPRPAPGPAPHT